MFGPFTHVRGVRGGSAAGLEAVGGEGEGNGFVIGMLSLNTPGIWWMRRIYTLRECRRPSNTK